MAVTGPAEVEIQEEQDIMRGGPMDQLHRPILSRRQTRRPYVCSGTVDALSMARELQQG